MPFQTNAFRFPTFQLDLERGVLERCGQIVPIRAKSFAVLAYLVRHPNRIVSKDELVAALWHRVAVTDDAIAQTIKDARRAIGDKTGVIVRTLPKRGYLLVFEPSPVTD